MQAIGDVRLAMEGAFEVPNDDGGMPAGRSSRGGWRPLVLVGSVMLVLGALISGVLGRPSLPGSPAVQRFTITESTDDPVLTGVGAETAISPDGQRIAYLMGAEAIAAVARAPAR